MELADEGYVKAYNKTLNQEVWVPPSAVSGVLSPTHFGAVGGSATITSDDIAANAGRWLGMTRKQVLWGFVDGTVTGSGNATVVLTAAGMTGSPKTFNVAVLNGDTAAVVAGKIVTALLADSAITALFSVTANSNIIVLEKLNADPDDRTLSMAVDDGTSAGLTATTSRRMVPGAYAPGWSWDTVAWSELGFQCYGPPGAEYLYANNHLTKAWDAPPGKYQINRPVLWTGLAGFRGDGVVQACKLIWTGEDEEATMFTVNGMAYGDIKGLTFEASQECYALLEIDYYADPVTLAQQNFTLASMTFHQNYLARYGWVMNRMSVSGGQGDTLELNRVSEYSSPADGAGFYIRGSNALMIDCKQGDSQGHYGHGCQLDAAQVDFYGKHFENPAVQQIRNRTFNVYAPNAIFPVKISNCRSESSCLSWGAADLENCSVEAAVGSSPIYIRSNEQAFRFGHVAGYGEATGKGRAYIQIAPDPEVTDYYHIIAPYSETVMKLDDLPAPMVPDEHAGRRAELRFPNCTVYDRTIVSNTADTVTITPALGFLPADGPGQPCAVSSLRILLEPFPTTGTEPPDWDEVSSAFFFGAYGNPSEGLPGVHMEEGSDIVELAGSSYVGTFIEAMEGMTALVQGAGVGGIDLASEVLEVIDGTHLRVADEASTTVENTPCRIGTTVTDGTCVWMHLEYYAIVNARSMTNVRVGFGQVFSTGGRVNYDNVESFGGYGGEPRPDWMNSFLVKSAARNGSTFKHCTPCDAIGDPELDSLDVGSLRTFHTQYDRNEDGSGTGQRFPDISTGPDRRSLLPAGNVYSVLGAGLKLTPFTLAQIEAAVADGVDEGTFWFGSDAVQGTSPAEDGGTGALVVYAGGVLTAVGVTSTTPAGTILDEMDSAVLDEADGYIEEE